MTALSNVVLSMTCLALGVALVAALKSNPRLSGENAGEVKFPFGGAIDGEALNKVVSKIQKAVAA